MEEIAESLRKAVVCAYNMHRGAHCSMSVVIWLIGFLSYKSIGRKVSDSM